MFETALTSLRPRRKGFVLVSTGLHAALAGALILPPMLRMPDLGAEPPDQMPRICTLGPKAPPDEPRRLPPSPPSHTRHQNPVKVPGGSSVRTVVTPTSIGDLPKPLAEGAHEAPEKIGSSPLEPTGDDGDGVVIDDPGVGEEPIPASGPDVTPPVAVSTPPPSYPEGPRIAGLQGMVILEAVIGRDGLVRDVRVLRGVNPLFDRAATEAVLRWRYRPAVVGSRAVAVYLTVTVNFQIHRG